MNQRPLGTTGIAVSPIGFGTVEIGIPGYAVGQQGLMSEQEAISLLRSAVEQGVTYFDTARGYGVAEERIGKSGIASMEGITVGTKCGQFLRDYPDMRGADLEKKIREEIDTSRKLLGLEMLPLVQLHIELPDYQNLDKLLALMSVLKEEGKVGHVGVASRGEHIPITAMESGSVSTIQVAYSILDQRMDSAVLAAATTHGVGVINRSVLLKGVLSPAREHLPAFLAPLREQADKADAIARELDTILPALAIRFVLSNPAVTTALIGTTKLSRLEQAIAFAEQGPLPQEVLTRLKHLAIESPELVDPSLWPKG